MRLRRLVPYALLASVTAACYSTGFEAGEYDYNYDSPRAVPATAPPAGQQPAPVVPPPAGDPPFPLGPVAEPARVIQLAPGDTLYSLSVRHLGTGRRWREIAQLNGLSEAQVTRLSVGQTLRIPAR